MISEKRIAEFREIANSFGPDTAKPNRKAFQAIHSLLNGMEDDSKTIADLQAIVEKLPKCWRLVDGKLVRDCPMVPGMTVWFYTMTGALASDVVLRFETVGSSEYATIHTKHGWMQCVACYDTKEAAEAARKGEA